MRAELEEFAEIERLREFIPSAPGLALLEKVKARFAMLLANELTPREWGTLRRLLKGKDANVYPVVGKIRRKPGALT